MCVSASESEIVESGGVSEMARAGGEGSLRTSVTPGGREIIVFGDELNIFRFSNKGETHCLDLDCLAYYTVSFRKDYIIKKLNSNIARKKTIKINYKK